MGTKRRGLGRKRIRIWILGAMMIASVWAARQLMAQTSSSGSPDNSWMQALPTSTGIPVGQKMPAFSLPDQNGKRQDFNSIKGPNGAAIYFMRSADW